MPFMTPLKCCFLQCTIVILAAHSPSVGLKQEGSAGHDESAPSGSVSSGGGTNDSTLVSQQSEGRFIAFHALLKNKQILFFTLFLRLTWFSKMKKHLLN